MMKRTKFILFLVFYFLFSLLNNSLFAESGIYDRIGIIPEHGLHGAVPEENIDLFTGNLTLRFLDIYLPGPNGFDLKLWRIYNSKILKDRLPAAIWEIQQEPYSWVGMGWSMHMGRLHYFNSLLLDPVIEFPDGRWETAYLKTGGSTYITREFLKYDKDNYKLYFKDGTIWTFGEVKNITYVGGTEQVRVVTRIENSFGHHIDITYHTGRPTISKITDSMGREIHFNISGTTYPKLESIRVKDAHGNNSYYYYTVGAFSYGGYYKLEKYDPPELPAANYYYHDGQYDHYELIKADSSFGGTIEYEYDDHTFYFNVQPLDTRVVKKNKINFYSSSSFKTWEYTYPNYYNIDTGTVLIDGPEYDTQVTYHAYSSSTPWKIGLLKKKSFNDNSYYEEYEWEHQIISETHWYVLTIDMGNATAPLLSSINKTREGDAESEEEYLYERSSVKEYGLPTKIKYYANGSYKSYKTLEYYFESSSTFEDKYMLSYLKEEKHYSSGNTKLKETQTSYYTSSGKCGAIDWIKRWRSGSAYLNWDYTYSSSNPNLITITINLPGSAGTETYKYSYGVLSEIERPGYTELSRTISEHDSSILSETNQHGGTMDFSYDSLGRIEEIDMPSGFNDINASWSTNLVTITQAGNTIVKYWDGMGRDTGYKEEGDGIILYYRKSLDSEGRVIAESKGSTDSSDEYEYDLTAAGQIKKITDPRGKITTITHSGDKKTVTDPEGNSTEFEYNGLPGLVTKLKDAENRYSNYTYDPIGRITEAKYNNARTQSFSYNGTDNLTSESHPETGLISYTYNSENNLWKKTWSGTQIIYSYNSSNQLTSMNDGDETITYGYDPKGRVDEMSSNKGWSRDNIEYNSLGSVTEEDQGIPGLGTKTISYAYSGNNNLEEITYPDGKQVSYTNNGLNMPETVTFNSKSLVSQIAYGINKQPTYMTISGNNSTYTASYNSLGFITSAKLVKGGSTLYWEEYGYDNTGNIVAVDDRTANNFDASFSYDSLYRLTDASYTGGKDFDYTYDYYGNITNVKENGLNVFNVSHNSKNQISSSGYTYDNFGNMTQSPAYHFNWDNKNRLKEIQEAGVTVGEYLYDERGLRLRSKKIQLPAVPKDDLLSTWADQGVYYRNSDTGEWVYLASPATQLVAGDLDNDGIDDLIGIWPGQGGVWTQYSSSGEWVLLSSTADWISAGDMNGDGWDDLLGTWSSDGVYYRDSSSGSWVMMAAPADQVTAGDLDDDGIYDLIGLWLDQGGVWVKYSSTGNWALLSSPAISIASGDMNGDGWDDFIGTWDDQGVMYRDSSNGEWIYLGSPALQIATGDIDGDRIDDLLGQWSPPQEGVWVRYSNGGSWQWLASPADWISAGRMRDINGTDVTLVNLQNEKYFNLLFHEDFEKDDILMTPDLKKKARIELDNELISFKDDHFYSRRNIKRNNLMRFAGARTVDTKSRRTVLPESYIYSYYIYSFDGRLIAEYNNEGICIKDYIYIGNQLIAEYRPQDNKYYYYNSDQINSTRMITDDSGTVVYSATYDPYGGIQKTWASTYEPTLKFSGKERDYESGLDYFGARYYYHNQYRFISVDPVINIDAAVSNPQLWNLYAYCRNNPVTFVDPDGETSIVAPVNPGLNRNLNAKIEAFINNAWLPKWAKSFLRSMLHLPETRGEFAMEFSSTILGFGGAIEIKAARAGRMALAKKLGREGEIAAGIFGPKQRVFSRIFSTISGYRVPDELTSVSLREIKNVLKLSNTAQLREYFKYARQTGRTFILETRANTRLSGKLRNAISKGKIIHKIIGR